MAAASSSPKMSAALIDSAATISSPKSPRSRLRPISTRSASNTGMVEIAKPNRPRGLESRDAQAKSKSDSDRGNRNEEGAHGSVRRLTARTRWPPLCNSSTSTRPVPPVAPRIKGGKALETMARVRALVVDKTGTLTAGRAKGCGRPCRARLYRGRGHPDRRSARSGVKAYRRGDHRIGSAASRPSNCPCRRMSTRRPARGFAAGWMGRLVAVGGVRFVSMQVAQGVAQQDDTS